MALNIAGIDKDPDLAPPSRENLLKAAEVCSSPAATKSQLLLKLDALRSVMPFRKPVGSTSCRLSFSTPSERMRNA
jgi:hypothetical protein